MKRNATKSNWKIGLIGLIGRPLDNSKFKIEMQLLETLNDKH